VNRESGLESVTSSTAPTSRASDPLIFARADGLGNLAHAAALDPHASQTLGQIGDRTVKAHQTDSTGAKKQRHRLRANDPKRNVHDRRSADQRRRLQDPDVTVVLDFRGLGGFCRKRYGRV
jgi:hypothetical protein